VSTTRHPWWKRRVRLTEETAHVVTFDPSNTLNARRWLEKAFEGLSPDDRALVTLFELEEWTLFELAELYGKSEGTLKVRLFRARRKMRQTLQTYLKQTQIRRETGNVEKGAAECGVVKPNPE